MFQLSCSIRSLASFLGNIVLSFEAVTLWRLYYHNIEEQKTEALKTLMSNFDVEIKQLSLTSLSEIKWWYKYTKSGKRYTKLTPKLILLYKVIPV